jgi:hypothetical protein
MLMIQLLMKNTPPNSRKFSLGLWQEFLKIVNSEVRCLKLWLKISQVQRSQIKMFKLNFWKCSLPL